MKTSRLNAKMIVRCVQHGLSMLKQSKVILHLFPFTSNTVTITILLTELNLLRWGNSEAKGYWDDTAYCVPRILFYFFTTANSHNLFLLKPPNHIQLETGFHLYL